MTSLQTAWIQGKSQGNIEKNLEYYSKKIKEASKTSAKLIVLPELFLWDYFPIKEDKKNFDLAISIDSKEVKHFRNLAKELKIVLTLPIFEKRDGGLYHNTCLVIENNGEIIGHYRKMHIPDDPGFYEKYYFTPGDLGFTVAKTSVGKIGVLICWDQWFPEAARIMTLSGAEILFYPTAIGWYKEKESAVYEEYKNGWLIMQRSHAIANSVYVASVNRVGKEFADKSIDKVTFWGNSFVCGAFGQFISHASENEEIIYADCNLSENKDVRDSWGFFGGRRTDAYKGLLKKGIKDSKK